MQDLLGFHGLTQAADQILRGTLFENYDTDCFPGVKEFVSAMIIPKEMTNLTKINTEILEADFTKGIRGWKESTSTSPSGQHLGHYKASLRGKELTVGYARMLNIPVQMGFSPKRWQQAVYVLLEKDKGIPKISRLRIIHLFEADYNLFLKLIWGCCMIGRAEEAMQESRKNRGTMDMMYKKIITFYIARQQCSNVAILENDAASCYDRILANLAMMWARRLGLPKEAIMAHSEMLPRLMKYMIKTGYGTSTGHYKGSNKEPLAGTGQGSGASPAIWLSICIVLLRAYSQNTTHSLQLQDPTRKIFSQHQADAFVDDKSLGFTGPTGQDPMDLSYMITTVTKCA